MEHTSGSGRTGAGPLWPALAVPVLGLALAGCGAVLAARGGLPPAGQGDPATAVGLAAAVLGCAVVLGWTGAAALAVLAVLAGHHRWERLGRLCGRCSPVLLRRAAAAALGLQLMTAPSAVADEPPSPFWAGGAAVHETPAPSAGGPVRTPGPATERAPERAGPSAEPSGAPPAPPPGPAARTVDGAVTVVRGDTLWSLTAAHLGPGATDAQIARAWPAWYELNRDVLVDGPHLLHPGQRLAVPDAGHR